MGGKKSDTESLEYAESTIDTVREPLIVLDRGCKHCRLVSFRTKSDVFLDIITEQLKKICAT